MLFLVAFGMVLRIPLHRYLQSTLGMPSAAQEAKSVRRSSTTGTNHS